MFEAFKGLFGKKAAPARTLDAVRPEGPSGTEAPVSPVSSALKPGSGRPKLKRINLERRFQIITETSQGSMSRVCKARDLELNRTVCLKVQDRAKYRAAYERAGSIDLRATEGEIGETIVHPRVVRTFEYGETFRGDYYVVMEYIDGHSLNCARDTSDFSLAQKVELLAQAAEGLTAVHEAGFIHHDFGPKNLLVDRNNQVKLIDFGLAIPNMPEFRRPGNRTGTLAYLAPEVIRREAKDERLDIYSWGVTAFEFLTGRLPFDLTGDRMAQLRAKINAEPYDLARFLPQAPRELCHIVRLTLAGRKEDRWPTAATLVEPLRSLPLDGQ